ncbi:isochorismate synthase MenF [Leptolyngbya sp. PCC 6406]|uniref:isochorismate synthase n=1 Tax=Leptolyngbya sp. PCC 6406 TaxID=1173264 RepID=UPI0002ABE561|nr:isochorismate synthase [Leptolyngbya sp. PCC 6406]
MTVAPSACLTLPPYETVFQWLKVCQHTAPRSRAETIVSLCFRLPRVDPLMVLLALAPEHQPQCYLESPARSHAIAAWGSLLETRLEGRDRFQSAHQHLTQWQQRILRPEAMAGPGPYFFNSFTFFNTVANPDPSLNLSHTQTDSEPMGSSPFAPGTLLLCPWQIVRQHQHCWAIANLMLARHSSLEAVAHQICQQMTRIVQVRGQGRSGLRDSGRASVPLQLSAPAAATFRDRVTQALKQIHGGHLSKQVVAYALDVTSPRPWQRDWSLQRLRSQHPDCYIFSFSTGEQAHFIGASPERLLSIRQGRLVTDALAGSAPRGATASEDHHIGQTLLNNPKEQSEHRLVVDFIVERLQAQGLQPRYGTPPGLLRLSHIQHLHTPIGGDVPSHLSPLQLVAALHPTPAVAGVPTAAACEQIRQSEGGDRGLYAAPFGWIDSQGNSEFIVGIRSALLQGNRARLFAGAGIVAGSDPDRELAEIQLKLQALAEALG